MFSWFSHLAIETNSQTNKNTWLEPVDNNQYAEATKDESSIERALIDEYKESIWSDKSFVRFNIFAGYLFRS